METGRLSSDPVPWAQSRLPQGVTRTGRRLYVLTCNLPQTGKQTSICTRKRIQFYDGMKDDNNDNSIKEPWLTGKTQSNWGRGGTTGGRHRGGWGGVLYDSHNHQAHDTTAWQPSSRERHDTRICNEQRKKTIETSGNIEPPSSNKTPSNRYSIADIHRSMGLSFGICHRVT